MSVLQKRGLTTVGKGVRQGKNYFVLLEVMQRRHVAHVLSVTDVVLFVNALTVGIDHLETTILTTQSSCRCGANNKNGGEEVKSFSDTIGKKDEQSANVIKKCGHEPTNAVVMGAAMIMEEGKPAMFRHRKKAETLNAPQAHRV